MRTVAGHAAVAFFIVSQMAVSKTVELTNLLMTGKAFLGADRLLTLMTGVAALFEWFMHDLAEHEFSVTAMGIMTGQAA